jgi:3-phosphoshikimate 1-carboxyvinyltransferase
MAVGTTVIKGVGELKVKETDRLKSIMGNFSRMGIHAREEGDSLVISGMEEKINAAELDSFGDHRIAMSMAIVALVSDGECLIRDTACVDTSYPGFLADLATVRA